MPKAEKSRLQKSNHSNGPTFIICSSFKPRCMKSCIFRSSTSVLCSWKESFVLRLAYSRKLYAANWLDCRSRDRNFRRHTDQHSSQSGIWEVVLGNAVIHTRDRTWKALSPFNAVKDIFPLFVSWRLDDGEAKLTRIVPKPVTARKSPSPSGGLLFRDHISVRTTLALALGS